MIKKIMLIMVNAGGNNNKFYELELKENGDVHKRWGRVGTDGVSSISYGGGEKEFNKIRKAKEKKGYKESNVNMDISEDTITSNGNMMDIAMEQIDTDEFSKDLIKRLVEKNIHNITSNTKIKYDIKTGYFKTPLGIITQDGVSSAIDLLNKIQKLINNGRYDKSKKDEFISLNEEYFTKIPTKIKNLRKFENLLINKEKVDEQLDICNALIDSIKIIEDEKAKIKAKKSGDEIKLEQVFNTSVKKLIDKKEFNRINKYFENSKNRQHGYSNNNAKIQNIYKVSIGNEEKEYRKDLSNQMELFHGTKVANLLSILKSGLLMPKYSPGEATGYMYGMGLYFASQSTKSLNYCDGGHWNNSSNDGLIYMFIADIAMGNYEIPKSWQSKKPKAGYDSFWAKSGQSGVLNDEMIVFNNNQIKLKYILEIKI
jgi:predicted DNA-binding WGR domain protein